MLNYGESCKLADANVSIEAQRRLIVKFMDQLELAVGCPPLRSEAYDPSRLDQQLGEQAQCVHRHATWFQFDARSNVVRLTKLYNWYGGDFVQAAGSTTEFAARYSPELTQALESGSPPIEWLPYDWKVNSLANKQSR